MVSLNTRVIRSLQVSILCLLLQTCLLGQEICDLRTDPNEITTSRLLSPLQITSTETTISSLPAIIGLDGESARLVIPPFGLSGEIRLSDFQANLPDGAVVQGIEVLITAEDSNEGVEDLSVRLRDGSGQLVGTDNANRSLSGLPWTSPSWGYGTEFDLWETDLDRADVNSTAFGVSINLFNNSSEEAEVTIDQLAIRVHYFMPMLICGHPCVSIVTTDDPTVVDYAWTASPELVTEVAFNQPFIFNIFAELSPFGEYEVCLTRTFDNGQVSSCCRALSYRDCSIGSIGDQVYNDNNANGVVDAGETGRENVTVELYDSAEKLLATQRTDATGRYTFDNILLGDYYIRVQPQEAMLTAAPNSDSEITNLHGLNTTSLFTMLPGEARTDLDFGLVDLAEVCGQTFIDRNLNGSFDNADEALSAVQVEIFNAAGESVSRQTTALDGSYCQGDLIPGEYRVEFMTPTGFETSPNLQGLTFTLSSGQLLSDLNQGYFRTASVGDFVWNDTNGNGIQDFGESGIPNVEINLRDCSSNLIGSTISDANGGYNFEGLIPGDYQLCIDQLPFGFETTSAVGDLTNSDFVSGTSCTTCITLSENENNNRVDLGLRLIRVEVSGNIWMDEDRNEVRTNNELGLAGQEVQLNDCSGSPISTALSGPDGDYTFTEVPFGDYTICLGALPQGIANGSSILNANQCTACLNIQSTTGNDANNFAVFTETATISFVSWLDDNNNGVFDSNESAVPNLTVDLMECQAQLNQQLESDGEGRANFEGLTLGSYYLGVNLPELYTVATSNLDFTDANGPLTTSCIDIRGTDIQVNLPLQEVEIIEHIICAEVYEDNNGNAVRDASEELVEATLFVYKCGAGFSGELGPTPNGFCSEELPEDSYELVLMLPEGYELLPGSDFNANLESDCILLEDEILLNVPLQSDEAIEESNLTVRTFFDDNENGIREATESSFPQVSISLFDCTGLIVDNNITDNTGELIFEELPVGEYYLLYGNMPGYTYSNDELELGSFGPGTTRCFELTEDDLVFEEGYHLVSDPLVPGEISGVVWLDENENGLYELSESILSNIQINLFDLDLNLMTSTVSTATGYVFPNLDPGEYQIEVVIDETFIFTEFRAGVVSSFDSEISDFATGRTEVITVGSLDDISNVHIGLLRTPDEEELTSFSGRLWLDTNQNNLIDDSESGVVSIVTLFDEDINIVTSVVSDNNGNYSFESVEAGNYFVQFELPAGLEFVDSKVGGVSSLVDSEVVQANGLTELMSINLGEQIEGINAGFREEGEEPTDTETTSISGRLWMDTNNNNVIDNGESGVVSRISLVDEDLNIVTSITSDNNGNYSFDAIEEGSFFVQFDLPAGFEYVAPKAGGLNSLVDSEVISVDGRTALVNINLGEQIEGINAGFREPVVEPEESAIISGRLWFDANGNNLIDDAELGVESIVTLFDEDINILSSVRSDSNGNYSFEVVEEGNYFVQFELPAGLDFVMSKVGGANSLIDSEVVQANGLTELVNLTLGDQIDGINAGFKDIPEEPIEETTISGRLWFDANGNNLLDSDESGVVSIVTLFDEDINILISITSDNNGNYSFDNVEAGNYFVQFELPTGLDFVLSKVGGANSLMDSEVIQANGLTDLVSISLGDQIDGINAGFKEIPEEPGEETSISGRLWFDANGNNLIDSDESGVVSIVTLFDEDINILTSIASDSNGNYLFDDVEAGNYFVQFELPNGFSFVESKVGGANSLTDSEVVQANGLTELLSISTGDRIEAINAGFIVEAVVVPDASIAGFVWIDVNQDGRYE